MPHSLARIVGLLRVLAEHLERRTPLIERITQEFLRREGLGYARERSGCIVAIRMPGQLAFAELTDCLLDSFPLMERGAVYTDVRAELFDWIETYIGREPSTIGSEEAQALVAHFAIWFTHNTGSRRVFVPCVLSRVPAPRFKIGPVTFEFIDRVLTSDFYPSKDDVEAALDRLGFDDLMQWMRDGKSQLARARRGRWMRAKARRRACRACGRFS